MHSVANTEGNGRKFAVAANFSKNFSIFPAHFIFCGYKYMIIPIIICIFAPKDNVK